MADHDDSKEKESAPTNYPPPAYSQIQGYGMASQGGPPAPPDQAGYPPQPYPQPYMQGYHCVPGQELPPGQNAPEVKAGYPYPPGANPYPPTQPGYPPVQGGYPHGPYPATAAPYGQPTTSVVVTQPSGATMVVAQNGPPDYLLVSVLACLCCFCPTGIFAIMYACQAKNANEVHDYSTAQRNSLQAKKLVVTSAIIGVCLMVVSIVLRLFVFPNSMRY